MNGRHRWTKAGYAIVLVAAVSFAVSCFLPYFDPEMGKSLSLWGLSTIEPSAAQTIAAVLILFTGPAALVGISLTGLLRPRPWTFAALIATSIVWGLMWIGTLVNTFTRSNADMAFAYWLQAICTGAVIVGATVVFLSSRVARAPNPPDTTSGA